MRFWIYVAAFMTFLGFNKQLDLQTLVTEIGRSFAFSSGWYDERQTVQFIVILGLALAAICAACILFWTFRRLAVEVKMAAIGICLLGAFIVIRAASFHHADRFLGQFVIGVRWNAVLELGCILFVAASGMFYLKQRPIAR